MRGFIVLIISLTIFCTQDRVEEDIPLGYKQIIKNFKMIETKDGIRSWLLIASLAYVYETNIRVFDLTLIFFNVKGETTATIIAPQGRLNTKTHDMVATGGVETTTNDSSRLNTDSLFFQNESTLIKTDSKVIIKRKDGTELAGQGMVTTPDLTKIEIGGKVEGTTTLEPDR